MRHPVLCPPADRAYAAARGDLAAQFPGWHLWESHFNATRTTRNGGVTLVCDTWAELTLELRAADTADPRDIENLVATVLEVWPST